ncbi:hypothetical protein AVM11_17695 [Sphingomonas melonis TY]|uniref:Uncharacterized protein n=3 Tax=Pseudomonadota TaxID=1224 RepID=A0A0L8AFX1_9GAMM|nr:MULTISPECIES: hypothetical protein [Sphingomonas]KOF01176.1 hypothetical protein W7K_00665 [Stenotrophomonas geniculata N1]MBI0533104.1 hypothetical protein [Sphingomonas sp. TX0522]ANC86221.1 hypothetical protein A7E77_04575 [Sphingomonas sp. NIC1]AOW24703.1 hypothetical protein BJP26_14930 [Sphingomonas melonis TY]KZB95056.1 hypothetical protein AVM11_17695 [Sphingomonas melonis TY]
MALAASGRTRAPRDMPPPLQAVTAVAILRFDLDADGSFSAFGLNAEAGCERDVVALVRRALSDLGEGELVTYNGAHDLNVLRFAFLRCRVFANGGVTSRLGGNAGRHRDLMPEIARDGRWPRLADVAAGLGFAPTSRLQVGPLPDLSGRAKAEVDVALTLLLLMHLEAERRGDPAVLNRGALAFGRYLAGLAMRNPHLSAILDSHLFSAASLERMSFGE